jgi:UDP-N-acetylmuramyl pentapeptide phosphotransferase/UDP-N-acetylglucosamine-1-phosphate transferase
MIVLAAAGYPTNRDVTVLLLAAGTIGAVGGLDDLRHISPLYRLFAQAAVALVVCLVLGVVPCLPLPHPLDLPLGWLAWPMTIVWLVAVTNFFNFMDGIDGLAGGQAVASCIGIAVAGWTFGAVEFAALLLAATIGFLIFNRPPARVFLGDIGSTFIGFAISAMPLLAPTDRRPMATFAVAIGLALFLLDPIDTLLRLFRTGRGLGIPHRVHSYQLLARSVKSRAFVAATLTLCGLALSIGGALSYHVPSIGWPIGAIAVIAFGVERFLALRPVARTPEPSHQ